MSFDEQGPILVVGPSRSGTELMRRILNGHSRIAIAAETHYFDDLRPRIGGGRRRLNAAEAARALAYFEAIQQHSYGLHHSSETPARPALDTSSGEGITGDEMFGSYCRAAAGEQGKTLWGEKTPRHIFRGDEILEAFPRAKIVVLVRDPRAVVASYRDWTNRWFAPDEIDTSLRVAIDREEARVRASYSVTLISLLWRAAVRSGQRLLRRHGSERVMIVRFEDLLRQPEVAARRLAGWLGVAYEPGMLDVAVVNSSYIDRGRALASTLPRRIAGATG